MPKGLVPDGLTDRQRKFVNAYATNGQNGTAAARSAGYGGSEVALAVSASRTLRSVKVQAALGSLVGKAIQKAERGAIADLAECLEYETAIMRAHKAAAMLADSGELSVTELRNAPPGLIKAIKIRSTTDAEGQVFAEHSVTLESGAECARSIRRHLTGEKEPDGNERVREVRTVILALISGDRTQRAQLERLAREAAVEIAPIR